VYISRASTVTVIQTPPSVPPTIKAQE